MSDQEINSTPQPIPMRTERFFQRFTLAQRWEHALLILSFLVLLLTGLPQKYRTTSWSQQILATPEQLQLVQTIHHIAAVVLILEVIYHIGRAFLLMARRRLPADIFVNWQDVKDAGQMVAYLLFLRKEKPKFGKYNFEQKVTYWFIFVGIGIMVVSGRDHLVPGGDHPGPARQSDTCRQASSQHRGDRCSHIYTDMAFLPCPSRALQFEHLYRQTQRRGHANLSHTGIRAI